MAVVNELAERAIAFIEKFNTAVTTKEEHTHSNCWKLRERIFLRRGRVHWWKHEKSCGLGEKTRFCETPYGCRKILIFGQGERNTGIHVDQTYYVFRFCETPYRNKITHCVNCIVHYKSITYNVMIMDQEILLRPTWSLSEGPPLHKQIIFHVAS